MSDASTKHLFLVPEFASALERGAVVKLLKAVKAGQELHPHLPVNLSARQARLSPLAHAYQWPWERKPEACMALLTALLENGADPNLPDDMGRRPLLLLLWLGRDAPKKAVQALIQGGADPCLKSNSAPGTVKMDALHACLLKFRHDALPWILEAAPAAAISSDPPLLLTLAWNNSTLDDHECQQVVDLLLQAGANPDMGDEFGRTGRNHSPRIASMIQHWEQAQAAFVETQALEARTNAVARPGARRRL